MTRFSGRVVTGRGQAAGFTCLPWVREQFVTRLGIDPHPGTLNLIAEGADLDRWTAIRSCSGFRMPPPNPEHCAGRCYAVRVSDWLPAGIVVPEVDDYSRSQIEVIAAVPLREMLGVADGDRVGVETVDALRARAVIFDVDGTLVDSLTAYRLVAERAASQHGVTITDAFVREALNTTRDFWDIALPPDAVNRADMIQALRREAARLWPEVLREHGRLCPGVEPVLRALRRRGAKLGIVTGSRRGSLDALRHAGLLDVFDAVVSGEEVTRRKPDPEGLVRCAARLAVAAGEAVYVGDTPLDMQAARAAGMFAVGVLSGAGDSAMLSVAGAHRLLPSIDGLLESSAMVI